ncbi:MAG: ion channel [Rickettsiaceae bacterium]
MEYHLRSHRYYIGLLIGLLMIFFIGPFFDDFAYGTKIVGASLIFTLIFAVLIISHNKKLTILANLLALPLIIDRISLLIGLDISINYVFSALCGILFILLVAVIMFRDIILSKKVDTALLTGSIVLYFMLGLMWGFIYLIIAYLYPESFNYNFLQIMDIKDLTNTLMYYSMVTLTTLGYGDITPLSGPARAMSIMQTVTGQMYLSILIARLVSINLMQKQ